MKNHIIPFFVVDRPASLLILKGVLLKFPHIKIGIMTHAFTSKNLWQMFKDFPYNLPLLYEDPSLLKNEDQLAESLVKMTDSGIFGKNVRTIDYEELFRRYNQMGTDFGIMIDVLRDSKATLKSAQRALKIYDKGKYKFKLVAVAQGKTLEEYLECYEKLSRNFEFIAVGGLLKKLENSARYVRVRDEEFLFRVLESIRAEFRPKWLFVLGCYHPKRHTRFEAMKVWGSDYKGWIFNYKQKRELISSISKELATIESKNGFREALNKLVWDINQCETLLLKEEKIWRETKDRSAKILARNKINQMKAELEVAYNELLMLRDILVKNNNLPADYKAKLAFLKKIMETNEQELRFQQVRRYIEENVYAQLQ